MNMSRTTCIVAVVPESGGAAQILIFVASVYCGPSGGSVTRVLGNCTTARGCCAYLPNTRGRRTAGEGAAKECAFGYGGLHGMGRISGSKAVLIFPSKLFDEQYLVWHRDYERLWEAVCLMLTYCYQWGVTCDNRAARSACMLLSHACRLFCRGRAESLQARYVVKYKNCRFRIVGGIGKSLKIPP